MKTYKDKPTTTRVEASCHCNLCGVKEPEHGWVPARVVDVAEVGRNDHMEFSASLKISHEDYGSCQDCGCEASKLQADFCPECSGKIVDWLKSQGAKWMDFQESTP